MIQQDHYVYVKRLKDFFCDFNYQNSILTRNSLAIQGELRGNCESKERERIQRKKERVEREYEREN